MCVCVEMGLIENVNRATFLPFDLPRLRHVLVLVPLVLIAFKLTQLIVKKRQWVRHLGPFPGPPAHWLFGHVKEVNNRITETLLQNSVVFVLRIAMCIQVAKCRSNGNNLHIL